MTNALTKEGWTGDILFSMQVDLKSCCTNKKQGNQHGSRMSTRFCTPSTLRLGRDVFFTTGGPGDQNVCELFSIIMYILIT